MDASSTELGVSFAALLTGVNPRFTQKVVSCVGRNAHSGGNVPSRHPSLIEAASLIANRL
jgi:hypothetical protein